MGKVPARLQREALNPDVGTCGGVIVGVVETEAASGGPGEIKDYFGLGKPRLVSRLSKYFKNVKEVKKV